MRNRRWIWRVAGAIVVLAQLTFVSVDSLAHVVATQYQIHGRWIGKFPLPDDNRISETENPVAVEVTIEDEGGKLSGTATFYVIRTKDGKPQIVGEKRSDMISPQFDGKRLSFSVKSKGQQPGTETNVKMRMTLISASEAELENPDDSSSIVFKLKKAP